MVCIRTGIMNISNQQSHKFFINQRPVNSTVSNQNKLRFNCVGPTRVLKTLNKPNCCQWTKSMRICCNFKRNNFNHQRQNQSTPTNIQRTKMMMSLSALGQVMGMKGEYWKLLDNCKYYFLFNNG